MFGINKKQENLNQDKKIDWFKVVSNISLIGLFLTVALVVLMITGIFKYSAVMLQVVVYLAIICIGLQLTLNWVKNIAIKKSLVVSYVFLGLAGLCIILWVIGAVLILNVASSPATLSFLKIDFIITVQFAVANFIASNVIKYKKTNIVFQTISYISYLFLDFWVTSFVLCLSLSPENGLYVNTGFIEFLFTKPMIAILIIATLYVIITTSVISKAGRKKLRYEAFSTEDEYANAVEAKEINEAKQEEEKAQVKEQEEDVTVKLEKLKQMLDKNLISQEEYDTKKTELLKNL